MRHTTLAFMAVSFVLGLASSASAQTTVIRPEFVLAVDNSSSMTATTGMGNNSCGYVRTRINDVGCLLRNLSDAVGDATFGLGMFNFGCRAAAAHYPNGISGCGTGTCPTASAAPAHGAFPALPYGFYGCSDGGRMVVPVSEARRYELRSWGDGVWSGCGVVPPVGTLGGDELIMLPGIDPNGATRGSTPNAGLLRAVYSYLANTTPGITSPYLNVDGTGMADPYAACRPVNVIQMTDGAETCSGTFGAALNAANLGCLQVDLNGNGTFEDPIPMSDPNPLLRGLYERNADLNGDGDCYDMGEQRAFRVRTYSIEFQGAPGVCACDDEIEHVAQYGGIAPHAVGCSTASCLGLAGGATGLRYGYYAGSEEEVAAVISQIVSDSALVETCNLLDDDCDTRVDETFPVGAACTVGVGACRVMGMRMCTADGLGTQCSATAGTPMAENTDARCSDGVDNDCDGLTDCADDDCVTTPTCSSTCTPGVELCDGIDNDCDMRIDEEPIARACGSSVGVCTPGTQTCVEQTAPGSGAPMYTTCTGITGTTETCNGLDDDCNGLIDDGIPVGATCGAGGGGACMPGNLQCVGGREICVGAVPAGTEICDCLDNDCDMMVDETATGALCPGGATCISCQCALPCVVSEFGERCPTGRVPDHSSGSCLCVSPPCSDAMCATMMVTQPDGTVTCGPDRTDVGPCFCHAGGCTSACDGRTCTDGLVCDPRDARGPCVENNCRGLGCPTGQLCDTATLTCVADRCAGVTCSSTEACRDGTCEPSCASVTCATGQSCVHGVCTTSACASAHCTGTQVCDPSNGNCVATMCTGVTCGRGLVCNPLDGTCDPDPCATLRCPSGQTCTAGECTTGAGTLDAGVADGGQLRVLAAGGGCGCVVAAPHGRSGLGWLAAFGIALVVLRRRRTRAAGVALSVLAVALLSSCDVAPYCFGCTDQSMDGGRRDGAPNADANDAANVDAACTAGAAERCNMRDDDCDGTVDEDINMQTSLDDCGGCGHACAPAGAFGACIAGVCHVDHCDVGHIDLNHMESDGCEYACLPTTTDDVLCNMHDDDCDGMIDENVMLMTDPSNCGHCGNTCRFANASGMCMMAGCVMGACNAGFYDLDHLDTTGCEYACNGAGGATEACNGLDDDCDGMVDEDTTAPAGLCRTLGECAGATATCMGALGFRCSYGANVEVDPATGQPLARELRCDGHDGNCNGATDEAFANLGAACTGGGAGACRTTGHIACTADHTGAECDAPAAGMPGTETCNGIDDDCDGLTDEPRSMPGTAASFVSTAWVQFSSGHWMMQYEASRPDATATAAGALTARACSSSGVIPWTGLRYADATSACTAIGARLCTEAEFGAACHGTSGTCQWAWQPAAMCSTYSTSLCNTADRADPDVLLTTGSLPMCFAATSGGNVFDLSGNAKEFVAARADGAIPVRGGSYNQDGFGARCDFDWQVVSSTFRFDNVGFRCCFDGATPP